MAFGTSPEEFRETEAEFVGRVRRRQIRAESHMAAEGIEGQTGPNPLDLVPNLMSVSLTVMVAKAVLEALKKQREAK